MAGVPHLNFCVIKTIVTATELLPHMHLCTYTHTFGGRERSVTILWYLRKRAKATIPLCSLALVHITYLSKTCKPPSNSFGIKCKNKFIFEFQLMLVYNTSITCIYNTYDIFQLKLTTIIGFFANAKLVIASTLYTDD